MGRLTADDLRASEPLFHMDGTGEPTDNGKKFIKHYNGYKAATIALGSLLAAFGIAFGVSVYRTIRDRRQLERAGLLESRA